MVIGKVIINMDYLRKYIDFNNSELSSIFDELTLWSSYFGQLLLKNIELRKNIKLLDVGCMNGFPLFELAHQLGNTCHLTGMDIWEAAIERAIWKKEVYNLKNVDLVLGNASKMPFENEQFDMIVSNLGINNFESPDKVMEESFRVLKPKGKVFITTNLNGHFWEFYQVYRTVLKSLGKKKLLKNLEQQENHRGSIESVRALFENAGFSIVKIVKDNFQWRFVDGSALLRHSLVRFGFLEGWKSILQEEEFETVFSKIEATLNEMASAEGELRMTVPMLYLEAEK